MLRSLWCLAGHWLENLKAKNCTLQCGLVLATWEAKEDLYKKVHAGVGPEGL